jgi:hypothetical protein
LRSSQSRYHGATVSCRRRILGYAPGHIVGIGHTLGGNLVEAAAITVE